MSAIVFLIEQLAIGIYIFLGLGILLALRRFVAASHSYQATPFELERDLARFRRANAFTMLIILLELAVIVFGVQNIVAPTVRLKFDTSLTANQVIEDTIFVTPTPAPLAQVNIDPSGIDIAATDPASVIRVTPTPTEVPPGTIEPNAPAPIGCDTANATLKVPANGMVVHQVIEVIGTAHIDNFGTYKLEISGPQTNGRYATIETIIQPMTEQGRLSQFNPIGYIEGWYLFRVAVFDQFGEMKASCAVNINIRPPIPTETPIPLA